MSVGRMKPLRSPPRHAQTAGVKSETGWTPRPDRSLRRIHACAVGGSGWSSQKKTGRNFRITRGNHCDFYYTADTTRTRILGGFMKRSTTGLAIAAAAGLSLLPAAPALAVSLPFANCSEAASVGVYNIPAGTPGYAPHLDADRDGFGCDAAGTPAYNPAIVAGLMAPAQPSQVVQMPIGGADTGVAQRHADNTAALALGGGVLVAAATGTVLVMRRRQA